MLEKKRSLTIDTKFQEFKDIDLATKRKIFKCFPYYITNDNQEMREEVLNFLSLSPF